MGNEANKHEWDFFHKKEDFEFEKEFRIMIKPKNKDCIKPHKGLPLFYPYKIDNRVYTHISLSEEYLIFHPYDKTLLEKDKKAMISNLNRLLNT